MSGRAWSGLWVALSCALALPACGSSARNPGAHDPEVAGAGGDGDDVSAGGASASAGQPSAGPGGASGGEPACVPSAAACERAFECGSVDDGCGAAIDCGKCPDGAYCQGHACVDECNGCVFESTCVGDAGSRPDNPCLACDAASGEFVAREAGACSDGSACTTGDRCEAGDCIGVTKPCSDDVACNGEERCDEGSGECAPGTPTCQIGVCDAANDECVEVCSGCLIGQICYENWQKNPLNPCEICDLALAEADWSVAAGERCGVDDDCQSNHVCSENGECQFDVTPAGHSCAGAAPSTTCAAYACDGAGACKLELAATTTSCGTGSACDKQDHCDGQGACEDTGPQAIGFGCGQHATCAGSPQAPTCQCVAGAKSVGGDCVDVDECVENTDGCDSQPDACVNDVLGFHCACPGNYDGTGLGNGTCSCGHADWSPLCEPWTQVSMQTTHACALSGGAVYCWGSNGEGQLGLGDRISRDRPTRVGSANDWTFITVGYDHSCGIRAGNLYCWGDNGAGQLGTGGADPTSPARVGSASDWQSVTTGISGQCGIRADGSLYCWGWNSHGQVGLGFTSNFETTPALVPTLGQVTKVSHELSTVCAITEGKLYCWGGNSGGQVGNGSSSDVTVPERISTWSDFIDVDVGVSTTCATRSNGWLYCWGSSYGATPARVGTASSWESVSVGFHECVLDRDGGASCWGGNTEGQLGDGTSRPRALPTPVAGQGNWEQIVTGEETTCGVREGGLYCWGSNEGGIRGTGFAADELDDSNDWTSVATSLFFGCAVKTSGKLYCWGEYPGSPERASPWALTSIGKAADNDWTSVDAAMDTACAIKGGDAYCWGSNDSGQVGNGTKAKVNAPVSVGPAGGWTKLSVGDAHVCGIRDADLYCWGSDSLGQIGNAALAAPVTPELVASGLFTDVATGSAHSCAIKKGMLYCWGSDSDGQIGNGAASNAAGYPTLERVGTSSDWIEVAAAGTQTCGRLKSGFVGCWGRGQATPTAVTPATTWTAIAAGPLSSCGIQNGSDLYCWGYNAQGQLGTGNYVTSTAPVAALVGESFASVSIDYGHACGLTTAGVIRCWGSNRGGGLGRPEGLLPAPLFDLSSD